MVLLTVLFFGPFLFLGALVWRLRRLEAALHPLPPRPPSRPGLWFLGHRADRRLPFQHLFLRLTPSDDGWAARRPDLFTQVDAQGRFYCTLGAGPQGGKLVLEFNRNFDVHDPVSFEEPCACRDLADENARILALLDAATAYNQALDFTAWSLRTGRGYNCNSMMRALADRAGLDTPKFSRHLLLCPGIERGLPPQAFGPGDGGGFAPPPKRV